MEQQNEKEKEKEQSKEKESKQTQEEKEEILRKVKDIQAKDVLRLSMRTKNLNTNKKYDMSNLIIYHLSLIINSVL